MDRRRYPGYRRYEDNDRDRGIYFGRKAEVEGLLHLILAEELVVFYGRSGVGKSSLLRAGLFVPLRAHGLFPIVVRLDQPKERPVSLVARAIAEEAARKGVEYQAGEDGSLWEYFKTLELWEGENLLQPVLVLDQFEEIFTLHGEASRNDVGRQLGELQRHGIPATVRERYEGCERRAEQRFTASPPRLKLLLTLREDYVGHLDDLAQHIPGVLHARYRMRSLTRSAARDCIVVPATVEGDFECPAFSYEDAVVEEILDLLSNTDESRKGQSGSWIEPFQLQMLCRSIEDRMLERARAGETAVVVRKADLGGADGMRAILQRFVEETIHHAAGSAAARKRLLRLCADSLLSMDGHRLSLPGEELVRRHKVSQVELDRMVGARLLVAEPRINRLHYELSHDTLSQPVRRLRAGLRRREQRLWGGLAATVAFVALASVALLLARQRHDLEVRERQDQMAREVVPLLASGRPEAASQKIVDAIALSGPERASGLLSLRNASLQVALARTAHRDLVPVPGQDAKVIAASKAPVIVAADRGQIRVWLVGDPALPDLVTQDFAIDIPGLGGAPVTEPPADSKPATESQTTGGSGVEASATDKNVAAAARSDAPSVLALALDPAGSVLVAAIDDGTLRCWRRDQAAAEFAWTAGASRTWHAGRYDEGADLGIAIAPAGELATMHVRRRLMLFAACPDSSSGTMAVPAEMSPRFVWELPDAPDAIDVVEDSGSVHAWFQSRSTLLRYEVDGPPWGSVVWSGRGTVSPLRRRPDGLEVVWLDSGDRAWSAGALSTAQPTIRKQSGSWAAAVDLAWQDSGWAVVGAGSTALTRFDSDRAEVPMPDNAGGWVREFAVDFTDPKEPREFRHFFVIADRRDDDLFCSDTPGTVVVGIEWDQTDAPRWTHVDGNGQPTDRATYIQADCLAYLGEIWKEEWARIALPKDAQVDWRRMHPVERTVVFTRNGSVALAGDGLLRFRAARGEQGTPFRQRADELLDRRDAVAPPLFQGYFVVSRDAPAEGISNPVDHGTIVRGAEWDGTTAPEWDVIGADGRPTGTRWYIEFAALDFLGQDWGPGLIPGAPVDTNEGHRLAGVAAMLAADPEGDRVVAVHRSGKFEILQTDTEGLTSLREWTDPRPVYQVALDGGGRWLVAGHIDGSVTLRDIDATGTSARELACPGAGRIMAIDTEIDPLGGGLLLAAGDHGVACLWSLGGAGVAEGAIRSVNVVSGALQGAVLVGGMTAVLQDRFGRLFRWDASSTGAKSAAVPILSAEWWGRSDHVVARYANGLIWPRGGERLVRVEATGRTWGSRGVNPEVGLHGLVAWFAGNESIAAVQEGGSTEWAVEGSLFRFSDAIGGEPRGLLLADWGRLLVRHQDERLRVERHVARPRDELRGDSSGEVQLARRLDGMGTVVRMNGSTVLVLDDDGLEASRFSWPRPISTGPIAAGLGRMAIGDDRGIHVIDAKGDVIGGRLAYPSHSSDLVQPDTQWVERFEIDFNASAAPPQFGHYFVLMTDETSEFPAGTIVKGDAWDSSAMPRWVAVDSSGSPMPQTRWISAGALAYLGSEWRNEWNAGAIDLGRAAAVPTMHWDARSQEIVVLRADGALLRSGLTRRQWREETRVSDDTSIIPVHLAAAIPGTGDYALVAGSARELLWWSPGSPPARHGVRDIRSLEPIDRDRLLLGLSDGLLVTQSRDPREDRRGDLVRTESRPLSLQQGGPVAYASGTETGLRTFLMPESRLWWQRSTGGELLALVPEIERPMGARDASVLMAVDEETLFWGDEVGYSMLSAGWKAELLVHCARVAGRADAAAARRSRLEAICPATQLTQPPTLLRALMAGRMGDARRLVAQASLEDPDAWGRSALWWAVARREHEVVEALLQRGAFTDAPSRIGDTPLAIASAVGDLESMRLLLEAGARVDAPDRAGLTPIARATLAGRLDAVNLLLQHGADAAWQLRGRGLVTLAPSDELKDFLRGRGARGGVGWWWRFPQGMVPEGLSEAVQSAASLEEDGRYDEAAAAFLAASEAGDHHAAFRFARLVNFRGVPGVDESRVQQMLLSAAGEGDLLAYVQAAIRVSSGQAGLPKADPWRGRAMLEDRVEELPPYGLSVLGYWTFEGEGGDRDIDRGLEMITRAAEDGYPVALRRLGEAIADGYVAAIGDPDSPKLQTGASNSDAFQAIERAASLGDPIADLELGRMLEHGLGIEKPDLPGALAAYERGRLSGVPEAAYSSGWMHEHGFGTARDLDAAALRYREAMALGDHERALTRLRWLGWEPPKDRDVPALTEERGPAGLNPGK